MSRVAIIGAGFSGTALAVQLLRLLPPGSHVELIDRSPLAGRGMAYGTCSPSHWLNVPAAGMSLDPTDGDGFLRWLKGRYPHFGPADFVPRLLYAQYLSDELAQARALARQRGVMLAQTHGEVLALERTARAQRLVLADGPAVVADTVVLATGHLPPRPLPLAGARWGERGFVADPYEPGWLPALPTASRVLLLGSGLTAIDALMALQDRGVRGPVWMLSRRGLLPQAHRWPSEMPPRPISPPWQPQAHTPRALLAELRRVTARAESAGCNWRDVLASLRAQTPALWSQWSDTHRRQFLRHLMPWWDTHRHRLAPGVHERLRILLEQGGARHMAGRVTAFERSADGAIGVHWQRRGGGAGEPFTVDVVVNCSGASAELRRGPVPPLLAALRDAGEIAPCPLGLGLAVGSDLGLLRADGTPSPGRYYLGPMLKARWWEAIAVPELRVHAMALAAQLAAFRTTTPA